MALTYLCSLPHALAYLSTHEPLLQTRLHHRRHRHARTRDSSAALATPRERERAVRNRSRDRRILGRRRSHEETPRRQSREDRRRLETAALATRLPGRPRARDGKAV